MYMLLTAAIATALVLLVSAKPLHAASFLMFRSEGKQGVAVVQGGEAHGLTEDQPAYPGTLHSLLTRGADLEKEAAKLSQAPAVDLSAIEYLPPIDRPGKILCVGLNYFTHAQESRMTPPQTPEIFARFANTLLGSGAPIVRPAVSEQLDFEAELAVVIGRGGRNIPKSEALDHVAGYSAFNDVSVRDYQLRNTQWTMGKNFDTTGPFGPFLVTPDDLPEEASNLRITTKLNGETVQDATTADLIFDVATLIAYISSAMTLEAGDVIITGTPGGVGMARKPKLWMKPGDRVEVEIEGVGKLSNPVAGE